MKLMLEGDSISHFLKLKAYKILKGACEKDCEEDVCRHIGPLGITLRSSVIQDRYGELMKTPLK